MNASDLVTDARDREPKWEVALVATRYTELSFCPRCLLNVIPSYFSSLDRGGTCGSRGRNGLCFNGG